MAGPTRSSTIWDPAIRFLHWGLAILVVVDLVRDDGDYPHRMIGYAAAAVVTMRLMWATFTRRHNLIPSPDATFRYIALLARGRPSLSRSHDPLGLLMAWFIWILVLLLALTGWMSHLDAFWGDDGIRAIHAFFADLLLAAILIHVTAVIIMSFVWRLNLPAAMITGRKKLPGPEN